MVVYFGAHFSTEIQLGGRYAVYFRNQVKKVMAAVDLIQAKPSVLWVLRGIDVATDELGIPTWVLVPLYTYLERESAFAAAAVQNPMLFTLLLSFVSKYLHRE